MDAGLKNKFLDLWKKYFGGAELPIAFYYSDVEKAEKPPVSKGHRCIFADFSLVRKGRSLCFDVETIGCSGGRRYLGLSDELMPDFEYFLSYGIPGKLEGERYKKTPDLVKEFIDNAAHFHAPAKFIVFKRWDKLSAEDKPEVVFFFAKPDVLSGLFTLANYDEKEPDGVFSPFAAGCGTVVQYPYLERNSERPRCVIGLFDVSARPYVEKDVLSFAVPINKFETMVANMEESFLITKSWEKVKKRI